MVQIIREQRTMPRKSRYPQHTFTLRHRPWQIQPMFIAPVLPGETMNRLLLQARAVTDPIANRLIGWWLEYHFFYVKLRDLEGRDDFTQMLLQLNYDISSYDAAADAKTYHYGPGIDWTRLCLDRVVAEYFRAEGEASATPALDGLPLAQLTTDYWMDSVVPAAEVAAYDIDLTDAGSQDGTAVTASEIDAAMRQWQVLQMQGLTAMSFEDYCAAYGVNMNVSEDEPHRPEWIRSVRDWTYPTNTVEPSTGVPTSACSWSIRETADKARFFKEPGFLLGVSVARPKVYFRNVSGSPVEEMNNMLAWMPALLSDDPRTSQFLIAQGEGPLQNGADSDGYWVDLKDLFMYGDQFVNFDPTSVTDSNFVDLPTAALIKRYADSDDADALFAGEDNVIEQDGIVSLNIKTMLQDTTPSQSAGAILTANQ